jgi:hypothetical protein
MTTLIEQHEMQSQIETARLHGPILDSMSCEMDELSTAIDSTHKCLKIAQHYAELGLAKAREAGHADDYLGVLQDECGAGVAIACGQADYVEARLRR